MLASVHCRSATSLTAQEAAALGWASGETQAVDASYPCEIAAGHDGSHIALAAISDAGQSWWWLCWASQARAVRRIDLCAGRQLDAPYLDECLLPEGHPGLHSYESPGG
jgi:hypothetical protein